MSNEPEISAKNEMYVRLKIGEIEVILADSRLWSEVELKEINEIALADLKKLVIMSKNDGKVVGGV